MNRIAKAILRRAANWCLGASFAVSVTALGPYVAAAASADLPERFAKGACYARSYTASHLAEHPQQLVTRIWFRQAPTAGSGIDLYQLSFGFTLRDNRHYASIAYCQPDARCSVEADGGSFQFTDRGRSLLMSITTYLAVEGDDFSPNLAESDDREFLLYPSVANDCQ